MALAAPDADRDPGRRLAPGVPRHGRSAPPSPMPRSAPPSRITCSTWSTPGEPFSVADWAAAARRAVAEVAARGRLPLLVGGTGLYVAALVDGYDLGRAASAGAARAAGRGAGQPGDGGPRGPPRTRSTRRRPPRTDLRNPRRVPRALERAAVRAAATSPAGAEPWRGPLAAASASDRPARGPQSAHRRARALALRATACSTRCAACWTPATTRRARRSPATATARRRATWRGSGGWSRRSRSPRAGRGSTPSAS